MNERRWALTLFKNVQRMICMRVLSFCYSSAFYMVKLKGALVIETTNGTNTTECINSHLPCSARPALPSKYDSSAENV
jgi:hypothetical protein